MLYFKVTSPNQYKKLESVKTVRLRGDWSDTGPNSKPNNQRYDSEQGKLKNYNLNILYAVQFFISAFVY